MDKITSLSPGALAFTGDAVYGLFVREMLAKTDLPIKELHRLSVEYVSAPAQAKAYEKIKDILTEKENEIFRRGRNYHTNNTPKSATAAQYHTATGVECLFGFLHLSDNTDRARELFGIITK